jgi:ATP-binding cassette subfamily B protein
MKRHTSPAREAEKSAPGASDELDPERRQLSSRDVALTRRFLRYVRPYRRPLFFSLVLLFASGALELAGPYLTKIAIDDAIPRGDKDHLLGIVALFLAVLALSFLTNYVQHLIMTRAGQSIMMDLRRDLFAHIQKMGLPWFDKNPTGRIVSRLTSDVETLNELLTAGLVSIVADFVTLAGIMIILFWMNPELALVTFAVLPVIIWAAATFRRKAREGFRESRERMARLHGVMQETFSGIEVVKLFGREKENDALFEEENAGCRDAWLATLEAFAIFFPLIQFLLATSLALVLWKGGRGVLSNALTFGELVAFLQYVQRFFGPLRDLSEKYNVFQAAMVASERIFGILDTPVSEDFAGLPAVSSLEGEIVFDDVSFRYEKEKPVLENVSFRVRPGERVALVGATGAGKTTVLSLLLGLYRPTSGRILLDGRDLATLDPRSVRRRLGTVLQDVFLFSADVDWNVTLGEAMNPDRVSEALQASHAQAFVARLPLREKERLGERGRTLSVGQRQLLSFARAIVGRPDVLLLDEATSSVDSETEALVQQAIQELVRGRTCLIVAHRLSTVRDADRILVFHHGRLHEEGTHESLLERGGLYARLVELQFGSRQAA